MAHMFNKEAMGGNNFEHKSLQKNSANKVSVIISAIGKQYNGDPFSDPTHAFELEYVEQFSITKEKKYFKIYPISDDDEFRFEWCHLDQKKKLKSSRDI